MAFIFFWIALQWGNIVGHGSSYRLRSQGYAIQEAKCAAVDDLRAQCLKEGDDRVPGTVTYKQPSCISEKVDDQELYSCTIEAYFYCTTRGD